MADCNAMGSVRLMDGDTQEGWSHSIIESGEWAGWRTYTAEPYEDLSGPFYYRIEDDGAVRCAFRAQRKHMNGCGFMHGGCLMTFADYALFCIGRDALTGSGSVTASLNGEFIDASKEGDLIECTGEVVRAGGSLVFIRGQIFTDGRTLLNFSAIVKKVRRKV